MNRQCPRCRQSVQKLARYCGRCGLAMGVSDCPSEDPGQRPDVPPPPDFLPCDGAPALYFKWETEWGGTKLLATETQVVLLFNAGPALGDAELQIAALDAKGQTLARMRPAVPELPRGEIVRVEVPSYELPDDVHQLSVTVDRCRPVAQIR